MPAYCTNRSELFLISLFIGGGVSTIPFQYHGDAISRYCDLPASHGYLNVSLVLAYLLPPLGFYCGLYLLNMVLIRLFGKSELDKLRKAILSDLTVAALSAQVIDADPCDLVEELAWTSLKKYWRPKCFQAEGGIRDLTVTGVQTCALPISRRSRLPRTPRRSAPRRGRFRRR